MPEIIAKKSGYYALGGIRIVKLTEGETVSVSQYEFDDIIKTSWAEPAKEPAKVDPVPAHSEPEEIENITFDPVREPAKEPANDSEFSIEFAEMLAEDGDKNALAEYVAPFGHELDKRKSIANMMVDLRAAVAGR
jgi:hypothetical protein